MRLSSRLFAVAALGASMSVSSVALAGDLNPPAGPIAATNRQILSQATTPLPLVLSQPGSYVLTSDLTGAAGQNGIVIAADNIVLDLNGFALVGVPGATNAIIDLDVERRGFVVKNGSIRDWPERALEITELHGARCEGLSIYRCGDGLLGARDSVILNCTAREINGTGFYIPEGGVISDCAASSCSTGFYGAYGATVTDCNAENCSAGFRFDANTVFTSCAAVTCGDGFVGDSGAVFNACGANNCFVGFIVSGRSSFSACNAGGNVLNGFLLNGDGNNLVGCASKDNGENGFYSFGRGNKFQSCLADNNLSNGFHADPEAENTTISECSATNNGPGKGFGRGIYIEANGGSVTDCVASANRGRGIDISGEFAAVSRNNCADNQDDGITIQNNNCRVEGNHCAANNASGIAIYGWSNRVEGNSVAFNSNGIVTLGGEQNLFIRNSAVGNAGSAYIIGINNLVGPIENGTTILTAPNPHANFEH